MKVVILAGGLGTRLSEETDVRPKPMVEIGGKPILWHIMKIYSHHGFHEFIICLGYKGFLIKEYFANYFLHMADVTFDMESNRMEVHNKKAEPWKVTLVDTGTETMTGGRIKRIQPYIGDSPFMVTYGDGVYPPGSVVIDPENRFLYFIEDAETATRYGVGVGRAGMSLRGTAYVARKAKWPSWTPTPSMIRREPRYARYAGGMPGGRHNPLGARALYLYRSQNDTMYRIHGTNQPHSIGQAMSSGCVRMMNDHVEQLYDKVDVGALVVILKPA